MAAILALDRGNESLKAALIESGTITKRWKETVAHPERMMHRILQEHTLSGVIFSSVVPAWTMGVIRVLQKMETGPIVEVKASMKLPFKLLVERPERLGPDRICAAAGVVASEEREAIIIDAGTAITVDVLSGEGFMGGAIFPGEWLLARALNEGTAALPLVDAAKRDARLPGRNTGEAIASGIRWGLIGAVKELVARQKAEIPVYASIWLTGGGAEMLAPHLEMPVKREPDLVFLGMNLLFALNSAARRGSPGD